MYERYMSMGQEVKEINWKQARGALYRWPQVMREFLTLAVIIRAVLTQEYSYAYQHVPANHRRRSERLSSDTSQRKRFQRCHGANCHLGAVWLCRCRT